MKPITRRVRRTIALVAGLAAASLALSGCLYGLIPGQVPLSTESLAPDTSGVDAALLPFYGQELEWQRLRRGVRLHHRDGTAGLGGPRDGRDRAFAHPSSRDQR